MTKAKIFAVIWLIVFASGLVTFAVIVKPTGEIDTSVITMTAEIFATALTFAGFETFSRKKD